MIRPLLAALTAALCVAGPAASAGPPPVRFILVGDSTMTEEGGWGGAFCADVVAPSACINRGKAGRSSLSYRTDGSWAKVTALLAQRGPWKTTYVLIQFGVNDLPGKPGRSTDPNGDFKDILSGFIRDVRAAGGTPVLVTPVTRRQFAKGRIKPDLVPHSQAMREVAAREKVPLLDLYADSSAAVEKMGPEAADRFAMAPPSQPGYDLTHLGPEGARYFSRMAEDELFRAVPAVRANFRR